MVAAVDLRMALQAASEHRALRLVVERGEVGVTADAVLLRTGLVQEPAIRRAVGIVARDAAVESRDLVRPDERPAVRDVAFDASTLTELVISQARAGRVRFVAIAASHGVPLSDRVTIGELEARRDVAMAARAAPFGVGSHTSA